MFAMKDIKFGEELCFNYCSITESEKEFESATCLCGTEVCSGRYLGLASDKKYLNCMKKYHNFVDRNAVLYLAIQLCEPGQEGVTQKDRQFLHDIGFRDCLMQGVPEWLMKWTCLVCEYILFEQMIFPIAFKDDYPGVPED